MPRGHKRNYKGEPAPMVGGVKIHGKISKNQTVKNGEDGVAMNTQIARRWISK